MILYEVNGQDGQAALKRSYAHNAPVLDVCYGPDDKVAFSAGMDWKVNKYARISQQCFADKALIAY